MLIRLAALVVFIQAFGSEGRQYGPPKKTIPPRPGVCLPPRLMPRGGQPCTHDIRCPGIEKCCEARDGRRYCVPPAPTHPGDPIGVIDPLTQRIRDLGFDERLPNELSFDVPSGDPTFLDAQPVGPGLVAPQPRPISVDPFGVDPRPVIDPRPDILDPRPDILDPRPDILDHRPGIFDPRPDILDPRPDIFDPRPDILDPRPIIDPRPVIDPIVDPIIKKPGYGNKKPVPGPGYVDPIVKKPGYGGKKNPVHGPGYVDPIVKNPIVDPGYVDPVIKNPIPESGFVDPIVTKPGYGDRKKVGSLPVGSIDPFIDPIVDPIVVKKPGYGDRKKVGALPIGVVDPIIDPIVDPIVVKKPGYGDRDKVGVLPVGVVDPITGPIGDPFLGDPRLEMFNPSCPSTPAKVRVIARITNGRACSRDSHCSSAREICCFDGVEGVCIIRSSGGPRRSAASLDPWIGDHPGHSRIPPVGVPRKTNKPYVPSDSLPVKPSYNKPKLSSPGALIGSVISPGLGRKPGNCPNHTLRPSRGCPIPGTGCHDDNDCPGSMKCCSSIHCTRSRVCMHPDNDRAYGR